MKANEDQDEFGGDDTTTVVHCEISDTTRNAGDPLCGGARGVGVADLWSVMVTACLMERPDVDMVV